MTREELEEGRRLQARQDKFAFEAWLIRHASDLLSLAEEAIWRRVEEEPPPVLEQVYIGTHVDALPIAYMDPVGVWSDANDEVIAVAPTHWRPLPKPPEKP